MSFTAGFEARERRVVRVADWKLGLQFREDPKDKVSITAGVGNRQITERSIHTSTRVVSRWPGPSGR